MSIFELLSSLFSYIFITIIYLFIFSIIRLIYMDIKLTSGQAAPQLADADYPELEEADDDDEFNEYYGILRVVAAREMVEDFSDEYILDKDVVTIGRLSRKSQCDIQIDDAFLSQEHLELTFDGEIWRAQDLGSRNGTFVNGDSIDACELENGDSIAIGGITFELEV